MGTALDRLFGGPVLTRRSLLDDFFNTGFFGPLIEPRNFMDMVPQLAVNQDEGGATLEVGLPGFSPDEVDVFIEDGVLYINAKSKTEDEGDGSNTTIRQRSYKRSVALPDGVNEENVAASLENGLLTIRVPRITEDEKKANRRMIAVNSSPLTLEGGGTTKKDDGVKDKDGENRDK